jgi:hypothetical protein
LGYLQSIQVNAFQCDETRPNCLNCSTANYQCSYTSGGSQSSDCDPFIPVEPSVKALLSPRSASTTPQATLEDQPPKTPLAPPYVNLTHLELYHNFTSNESSCFLIDEASKASRPYVIKHAFSWPFLMSEILALSSIHLSICQPERSQFYREESSKLQFEALRLFGESVQEVNSDNIIPAFLFSGMLGLHSFCEVFQTPSNSLDDFLARLVQSMRLLRGVRTILAGWWDTLLCSDIAPMLDAGNHSTDYTDDFVREFEKLGVRISQCSTLSGSQATACEGAVKQLIWVHVGQTSRPLLDGNVELRLITAWPITVSAEYMELIGQRLPEALIVLAHFSVLLHQLRKFWAVGNAGRQLLNALGDCFGEEWDPWLAWPRSVVYNIG